MSNDPTLVGAYQELRALTEDLVDAADEAQYQQVRLAITHWLQGHCTDCGVLIDRERRRQREAEPRCLVCALPMRSAPSTPPGDDTEVPF
ncbi:MAG: hypothetical protein HGA45_21875 [Chloroflexales bacterium]|nr:hypothetical protein [Chloroflexales bacterium]